MKPKTFPITIAVALSVLTSYGFYSFFWGEEGGKMHYATTGAALIFSLITLVCAIAVSFETRRITAIIKAVSGFTFALGLGVLALVSFLTNSLPTLIIAMGAITLVFIWIVSAIRSSDQ